VFGKPRPEFKRGSEEPETSEAAVAAVATLSRVPSTSMLVGERDNGRDAGTGGSSCVGESCDVSLVGLDSSWFSLSKVALISDGWDSGAA
jgi:hypothetical protein